MIELMTARTPASADLGRIALEAGDWQTAKSALEEALAGSDAPDILDSLSQASFWLNEFPEAIALRERAYVGYRAAGDRLKAAELAMWLAVRQATLYANATGASCSRSASIRACSASLPRNIRPILCLPWMDIRSRGFPDSSRAAHLHDVANNA